MRYITYHYLYNGDQLKGNYLYDINHLSQVVIYLQKLKFNRNQFEEAIPQ